jgi:hypothetical protein
MDGFAIAERWYQLANSVAVPPVTLALLTAIAVASKTKKLFVLLAPLNSRAKLFAPKGFLNTVRIK